MKKVCERCQLHIEESLGCVGHAYQCGREKFTPIIFGDEGDNWNRPECPECGARLGRFHHHKCIEERCPICRHHIVSCGCVYREVDIASPGVAPLPPAESMPRSRRKGRRKWRERPYMRLPNHVTRPLVSRDRRSEYGILLVYNICGLGNRENTSYYTHALRSILEQTQPQDEIIVSGCMTSPKAKEWLLYEFKPRGVSFNFIDEKWPVNVTFNHSVQKAVEKMGRFAGYLYIDSGIQFRDNTLSELRSRVPCGKYAMITAEATNDNGYQWWFALPHLPHGQGDFMVPIGKTLNLHVTVFSDALFEAYDKKIIPDVFASYSTESVFSFQCAAIKKQFCVCRGVVVDHAHAMDGGASGFRGKGFGTPDHVLMGPSMRQICDDVEGTKAGFGYEEFRHFKMHDPTQFDGNNHCINDMLLPFMKKNVFLSKELLDYEKISFEFFNRH